MLATRPLARDAHADHCHVGANRVETDVDEAYTLIENLSAPEIAIDIDRIMDELIEEGIDKFVEPFNSLMDAIETKMKQLSPA